MAGFSKEKPTMPFYNGLAQTMQFWGKEKAPPALTLPANDVIIYKRGTVTKGFFGIFAKICFAARQGTQSSQRIHKLNRDFAYSVV